MKRSWIEKVNKSDAKKLVRWWNGQCIGYFFKEKRDNGKLYDVIRQQ